MRALEALVSFVGGLLQPVVAFLDQHVAIKGVLGVSAVGGGLGVSLAEVEQWMRIGSLAIGMAVGVATFVSIVRKRNSK